MSPRAPISQLPTHSVTNTPPHIGDQDLWLGDTALREHASRQGADWAADRLARLGEAAGRVDTFENAHAANRFGPELRAFDRYGMRVDQVTFHPAYHDLMALAVSHGLANFAWRHQAQGAHVAHMALAYMFSQAEGGVLCPMAMSYAVIPVLRAHPGAGDDWIPSVLSTAYDQRDIPRSEKSGVTIGMFMTEKQGGSDVRANTTRAAALDEATGEGAAYRLTGHKFFCSAPMCDAFLTLAYTDAGLSCFLIPRWKPDGERNYLGIQRLKDKLGNRSNASAEMEFQDTWGAMIGEEGRGIRTIIDMVQANRIYCAASSAGMMRQGLVQALHHVAHRSAFQKRLLEQPLMRNVIADLAIEAEAAAALVLRVARALDNAATDADENALARIGTAIAKYWICKRAPGHTLEALECHGGAGYIEDSIMPRLYREAPVNSIWEGSGNVICLDVLRSLEREARTTEAIVGELESARGGHTSYDAEINSLKDEFTRRDDAQWRARSLTERLAVALQACQLIRHAPAPVSEGFCNSRLAARGSDTYGTLAVDVDADAIISRAMPAR